MSAKSFFDRGDVPLSDLLHDSLVYEQHRTILIFPRSNRLVTGSLFSRVQQPSITIAHRGDIGAFLKLLCIPFALPSATFQCTQLRLDFDEVPQSRRFQVSLLL